MEYQFYQDPAFGCQADFVMPHEALGQWLSQNLHSHSQLQTIENLLSEATAVLNNQRFSWQNSYGEYQILLEDGSAEIRHQNLTDDLSNDGFSEHLSGDDLSVYDQEAGCHCGLEDFIEALTDWHMFVTENGN